MKKVIVGRGLDCDIVIPDEKDNVSRQHLVISFNLLGRMKISDTSSNGTYINGRRMLKGTSMPVTSDDEIRLGDNWTLDWVQVNDPYKQTRKLIILILSILVLLGIGMLVYSIVNHKEEESSQIIVHKPVETGNDEWNKDSTLNVAPIETSIQLDESESAKSGTKAAKKKTAAKTAGKRAKDNGEKIKTSKKEEAKEVPIVN